MAGKGKKRMTIQGLIPDEEYVIQVRAVDDGEGSNWSPKHKVTTIDDTAGGTRTPAKAILTDFELNAGGRFQADWSSVRANTDGTPLVIARYEVALSSTYGEKIVPSPVVTGDFQVAEYSTSAVRGLFSGNLPMQLTAKVRAVNSAGTKGEWSDPITAVVPIPYAPTMASTPPPVVEGVTDAIRIRWAAPSEPYVAGDQRWPVGYRVYVGTTSNFVPDEVGKSNMVYEGPSLSTSYSTIAYSTNHYFKIASYSPAGVQSAYLSVGPAKPVSPFVLDIEAPPTPTITGATIDTDDATGQTGMKVDWTYPAPPSDLADFVLRYRPAGQTPAAAWEVETIPATADDLPLTATITKLRPYVDYEVQMRARDFYANESDWTATTTAAKKANVAPSTPATPTAVANTQQIQVTHSGNRATGTAMEADVVEYEVYASITSGFTPATANLLGKIPAGPAIVGTFNIPATGTGTATNQRWYVKVIAVDGGGMKSPASGQAQADVGLVSTANIGYAAITNAKIADLEVTKLTAGSGMVTDFNIKSTLTLGDAATNGTIQSFGFTQGSTGWRLNKSGLEINDGSVAAKALKIQNSDNLMPAQYADFEWGDHYYVHPFWNVRGQGGLYVNIGLAQSNESTDSKFGNRAIGWTTFANENEAVLWFGKNDTNYNIEVVEGEKYIFSVYLNNRKATRTWNIRVKGSNGNIISTTGFSVPQAANGVWTRYQVVVTIPAGVTKALVGLQSPAVAAGTGGSDLWIDGAQIERVEAGLEVASPWKPPASTTIEGAGITTGFLRSSGNISVNGTDQPLWSINLNGAAQFGDASIRGKLVVGPAGSDEAGNSYIASGNYVANDQGWKIKDDGIAEFANITSRAPGGTRIDIGNAVNPFESNQEWNMIQFFSANSAWSPSQIWVNYLEGTPNAGVMQISSPKLGGRDPAWIQLWSSETTTGDTRITLGAKKFEATADNYSFANSNRTYLTMDANNFVVTSNTYTFGDTAGSTVVFKIQSSGATAQRWSFRSPGGKRLDFDYNTLAKNIILSQDEVGTRIRLDFNIADLNLNMLNAANELYFGGASAMSNRPVIANVAGNTGIVFSNAQEVRMTSWNGGAYIPARASNWLTPSDMGFKKNVQEVNSTMLDKFRGLKAYDYDRVPHVEMTAEEIREADRMGLSKKVRYRGMSAQEIQAVMPEVVFDDDDGDSGLAVDIYGLLTNTIKAMNELKDEVDSLNAELASRPQK